jgi:hypothetical protein
MADKATKVRVLIAHDGHLPNHVILLSAPEAKAAVVDGWADDSAEGVAYAEAHEPQPAAAEVAVVEAVEVQAKA